MDKKMKEVTAKVPANNAKKSIIASISGGRNPVYPLSDSGLKLNKIEIRVSLYMNAF